MRLGRYALGFNVAAGMAHVTRFRSVVGLELRLLLRFQGTLRRSAFEI